MILAFTDMPVVSILVILTVLSVVIFFALWFLLNKFYSRTSGRWSFIDRFVEKTRRKGENPLIKKYGLFGLALVLTIPLPTIGVYGGTLLSWLMGMNLWGSFIAIVSGATISNSIFLFTAFGIRLAVGTIG